MFSINDYVVYQYWVCQISDIKKLDYSDMGFDRDNTYYILKAVYEKETFYIPVGNVDSLREPISKEEALRLIDSIPYLEPIVKVCSDDYKKAVHEYDCYSYARVVKSIHARTGYGNRKVSTADGRYLHVAEKYLHDELAFSLGMSPDEVEGYIHDRLEEHKTA